MPADAAGTSTLPNLEQALYARTNEEIKWYVRGTGRSAPARKDALVAAMCGALLTRELLESLLAELTPAQRGALAQVVHRSGNLYDADAVTAKFGPEAQRRGVQPYVSRDDERARPFDVFFYPQYDHYGEAAFVPGDLAIRLRVLLPEPPPARLEGNPKPPEHRWGRDRVDVHVAETEVPVFHDLAAALDLTGLGKISVSASTRLPTLTALRRLRERLLLGAYFPDDYTRADEAIRPAGLLMLIQAAGWVQPAAGGTRLTLTTAGQAAAAAPLDAAQVRGLWHRWLRSDLLDELTRAKGIKGQQSQHTRLTAPATRRAQIAAALRALPPGRWVTLADLLRYMQAESYLPAVEEVGSHGLFVGYRGWDYGGWAGTREDYVQLVIGSYVRVVLWEYAATLGIVDVAYVAPEDAALDFGWIDVDADYLTRYDGLLAVRLTPLGAYVLGLAAGYTPPVPVEQAPILRVLPTLEIVLTDPARVLPNDRAFVERIAVQESDQVYRLSRDAVVDAVDNGLPVAQARDFLAARSGVPAADLPQTVRVFFADIERRLTAIQEAGSMWLLEADDPYLLAELANEAGLRGLVQTATIGDRTVLLVPEESAGAARRLLKKLGYLPRPPGVAD